MNPTHKAPPGLVWCGPIFDPSGYADEGRGLVGALDALGVDVALRPVHRIAPGFREGLPAAERAMLDRQVARERASEGVLVQHYTADAFFQMSGPVHHVGRTMFETDGIPPSWVRHCNQMDELWLPSQFNIETFRGAGVHVPIVRVPGGIDSRRCHPDVQPMAVPGLRGTVFLAVFEWRLRKGWDVLLRAWADAFSPDDDVTLVLRTYPINKSAGTDNETVINGHIDAFLAEECNRTRADVAPIVVLGRTVPGAEMPALYRIASALVAPTRGEGWGRPFMEAMASGVPVIATRWSAHLEFMHDENSLLLDVDRLDAADGVEVPLYQGQRWAMPSAAHLTSLLQRVHAQPGEAKAIGARAREDMVNEWPWRRAATVMADRLREIRGREGMVSLGSGVRDMSASGTGPLLAIHGQFFHPRAGDQDAERVVSAIVRAWPHAARVHSHAASQQRPSNGSALSDAWRAARDPDGQPPALTLTWLSHLEAGALTRPATGRWIVCTGEAVSRSIPGRFARVLRDQADEIWVPDSIAWAACRAIDVPEERLWLIPPVPPAAHITPWGARAELESRADTVFLLPALDPEQADNVTALLRLWQRVFDANHSALLLLYAPYLDMPALSAWHRLLIDLLASGRLLHGAPIRILRDALVGDELTALVRACDVLLDPLPSAATTAVRRMAKGSGVITLTGGGATGDSDDVGVLRSMAEDAAFDVSAWREGLLRAAHRTKTSRGDESGANATTANATTGNATTAAGDLAELGDIGAAASARLLTLLAALNQRGDADSLAALEPWPVHDARAFTVLAHVDWHDGTGGGVLRSYLDAFDQDDDITLVLCLDPAQGVRVEDVQRMVGEVVAASGRDGTSEAEIVLIPEPITDAVRARLLVRCSAVVSIADARLGEWARAIGCQVIDSLTRATWRNALASSAGTQPRRETPPDLLRTG